MDFPYKRYSDGVHRPVVRATLRYGSREFDYEVLVDSGADMCVFGIDVALFLGIDLRRANKGFVAGVGANKQELYIQAIELEVAGTSFIVECDFLSNVSQFNYGVVGRKGFFEQFLVSFNEQEKLLSLK